MTGIKIQSTRYAKPEDGKLEIAKVGDLGYADRAKLKRVAKKHGFEEVDKNQFVHEDGSWFKADAYGRVSIGVRQTQLYDAPTPWFPVDRSVKRDPSRPEIDAKRWSWFQRNTALGKTPVIADDAQGRATLSKKGFVLTSRRNQQETWVHPDGSWFKLERRVTCGWKGYELGELPFQRW